MDVSEAEAAGCNYLSNSTVMDGQTLARFTLPEGGQVRRARM